LFSFFAALGGKKGKLGKLGPVAEKKVIPVETDAKRLVNYVCGSNINIKGEDVKVSKVCGIARSFFKIPL
jgi:large subunit ribosomal protein L54